jgi:hypothetical protein
VQLKWNASNYGGLTSVRIPISLLWTPDVVLFNRQAKLTFVCVALI